LKVIIDATALRMYPVGKPGFRGGTETYVERIAKGLANKGHETHVITPDLEFEERRGLNEFWWPAHTGPLTADVVAMVHSLEGLQRDYEAPVLVFMPNGVDPDLGPNHAWGEHIDAVACFSQKHIDLMRELRPTIPAEKCFVTGLGIDIEDYTICGPQCSDLLDALKVHKEPGRLLYANDPARGLWHVLDLFDHLRKEVPEASLHVGYDFSRQFQHHRWAANALAEALWDCKRRLESTPGVRSLGALSRPELVREQLECQVHAMPSDPPNTGSQIHGISQMEAAAAGAALVLSDTEAFPEVFGEAALVLPLPGTFVPQAGRRFDSQDWAENISVIIKDPQRWQAMSRKSRALAERHTWQAVVDRWEAMLETLVTGVRAAG
jgi:glycosyltransferase involved in cell wall biosynthesis